MLRLLNTVPLMLVPLIAYTLVIIGGVGALEAQLFSLSMMSGGQLVFRLGDAVLLLGLVMLFVEIVRSTSTKSNTLINHGLSMGLLLISLIAFLLVAPYASAVFLLLTFMIGLDVLAGFMVTIVAARRDFGVGDDIVG